MIVALLTVSIAGVAALSQAQRLSPKSGPIEESYFGLHIHHLVQPNPFRRTTAWPDLKFSSWRLMDAYVKWRDLEPMRGQWNFGAFDRYVRLAEIHGVSLLYTFGHPPQWASARPKEASYTYGDGVAAEPADMADWENYVRAVATRYRGRIKAYEIWNEPWFKEIENVINKEGKAAFYSGTAAKMVELARVAYRVIKEVDPAATVLTPAFDHPESGARRLELYLKLGGAAFSDAVAFHFYTPTPEAMLPVIAQVREVMARYGIAGRELWNTETGYATENPDEPELAKAQRMLSESEAAAFVSRALILAAAAEIKRFYWYAWDNGIFGLTRGRGREPSVAAQAYSRTRQWLLGTLIEYCESVVRGQWSCAVRRFDRRALIVWRTEGTSRWIPPAWVRQVETLAATEELAPDGAIFIGTSPRLLKSDRLAW